MRELPVVRWRLNGWRSTRPESTVLSATPRPTGRTASCMTTLAAPNSADAAIASRARRSISGALASTTRRSRTSVALTRRHIVAALAVHRAGADGEVVGVAEQGSLEAGVLDRRRGVGYRGHDVAVDRRRGDVVDGVVADRHAVVAGCARVVGARQGRPAEPVGVERPPQDAGVAARDEVAGGVELEPDLAVGLEVAGGGARGREADRGLAVERHAVRRDGGRRTGGRRERDQRGRARVGAAGLGALDAQRAVLVAEVVDLQRAERLVRVAGAGDRELPHGVGDPRLGLVVRVLGADAVDLRLGVGVDDRPVLAVARALGVAERLVDVDRAWADAVEGGGGDRRGRQGGLRGTAATAAALGGRRTRHGAAGDERRQRREDALLEHGRVPSLLRGP